MSAPDSAPAPPAGALGERARVRRHGALQIGLQGFLSDEANDYGALMAASGLLSLPIFVLYLVLQRQVIDAFVRSGLR